MAKNYQQKQLDPVVESEQIVKEKQLDPVVVDHSHLVEMHKDGNTIHVHPSNVKPHQDRGWK